MIEKKKIGNAGFSLIETMVAIIILSIIFIPLTNSFIQSIKAGKESKVMQAATNAAQQTMEDFKQDSLLNLADRYTLTSGSLRDAAGNLTDTWDTLKFEKKIDKSDNGCSDFVVKIEVSKKASPSSPASGIDEINAEPIPKMYSMESPSSAVMNVDFIYAGTAQTLLGGTLPGTIEAEVNALRSHNVKRTIVLTLEKDSSTGNTIVRRLVKYSNGSGNVVDEAVREINLSTEAKSIYMYCKGLYDYARDTIEIRNDADIEGMINIIYDNDTCDAQISSSSTNTDNLKFISNVSLGSAGGLTAEQDYLYSEARNRRYEVTVSVLKKESDTYPVSKMISTRGE